MTTEHVNASQQQGTDKDFLLDWLTTDEDSDAPPDALLPIYKRVNDREKVKICERARKRILRSRKEIVAEVVAANAALAPLGEFRAWCEAWGLNYRSASTIVAREKARKAAEQQAADTAMSNRTPAKTANGAHPAPASAPAPHSAIDGPRALTVKVESATALEDLRNNLLLVIKHGEGIADRAKNDWAGAITSLFAFWWEHAGKALEAQAAADAEAEGTGQQQEGGHAA